MNYEEVGNAVIGIYQNFLSFFPPYIGNFINFLILVMMVVLYVLLVWKFYKFVSEKDFLGLNLKKYNRTQNDFLSKLMAGILYFIEYIVLSPLVIFTMFVFFTFFLIVLAENTGVSQIIIISAVIIAAIRITAYYKRNLSQEISKMLPLMLLAVAVLNPSSFSSTQYLERIITSLSQIPQFIISILNYLFFIIVIEVLLRFFSFIFSLFDIEDEHVEETEENEEEQETEEEA